MESFITNARSSLDEFEDRLGRFRVAVSKKPVSSPKFPSSKRDKLLKHTNRAAEAVGKLRQSISIVEQTGVDIVDIQSRIGGESASLGSALQALDGVISKQHFIHAEFHDELVDLEEAAQDVAGAIFPSAIDGLRKVNIKLWEFDRLEWVRYQRKLGEVVQKEKLTSAQQIQVEETFARLRGHFEDANRFLNQLARVELLGSSAISSRMKEVKRAMATARQQAGGSREREAFKPFKGILGRTRKTAEGVGRLLGKLRIPAFPPHSDLEELTSTIAKEYYESLTGIGTFAMLNIASQMRTIRSGGDHLLSGEFGIRIFRVFPDRFYFEADESFLQAIEDLKSQGTFDDAPAALHRFRDGSVKQTTQGKGNLQLSYTRPANGRMNVDVDIDLFRNPLLHLFGEVFVNHLTGGDTNQFKVLKILESQRVVPIGGFQVLVG